MGPLAAAGTGEVAEWLNVPDSKSGIRASVSWVRIPPSPPVAQNRIPNRRKTAPNRGQPRPQRLDGELRPFVGANVVRHATHQHYIGQRFDHHLRPDTALHADRQGLPGVFVDQAEQAYRPAAMRPGGHEVIAPDVVRPLRPQPFSSDLLRQGKSWPDPLLRQFRVVYGALSAALLAD